VRFSHTLSLSLSLSFSHTTHTQHTRSLSHTPPRFPLCTPGELAELSQQLQSPKKADKRDAVKKVIASMTVGKDVRCDTSKGTASLIPLMSPVACLSLSSHHAHLPPSPTHSSLFSDVINCMQTVNLEL
jgi:hypothetical protein